MNRKRIAVVVTVAVMLLVIFVGMRASLVSQIVESEGHRTIEYGLFGSSFPARNQALAGFTVKDDVFDHIRSVAPIPSTLHVEKAEMPMRIRRPSNTEWFARIPYTGDPKKIAAYYKKFVTLAPYAHRPGDDVDGTLADGTRVWIYFDTTSKFCGIKLTKPGSGL